jgi:hypothetical protein
VVVYIVPFATITVGDPPTRNCASGVPERTLKVRTTPSALGA